MPSWRTRARATVMARVFQDQGDDEDADDLVEVVDDFRVLDWVPAVSFAPAGSMVAV